MTPVVYIGTAGWSVVKRFAGRFPDEGSHLQRYAATLNAAEINSSFYRHHRPQTYERWAASVPEDFRFAVKLPKALTHAGALKPREPALARAIDEASGLGNKLGAFLVQLPPKLEFDLRSAERFFATLRRRAATTDIVCEPRHPSWAARRAQALLRSHRIARVAADPPLPPGADVPAAFRDVAYFRWHGTPRVYWSNYGRVRLERLYQRVLAAARPGRRVWCVFDNTAAGHALGNALWFSQRWRRQRAA
jgi:uncharacterized protein YecE (DUF72 family)